MNQQEDPSTTTGPRYWRSLEERASSPEFEEWVRREWPEGADVAWDDPTRRDVLRVMAASFALAGLTTGCGKQPHENLVPYVRQPEKFVPGRPLQYATTATRGGYALGVLVESHMGRPTKIEGNPEHPASGGATDLFAQAASLEMYDPDRSQTVKHVGQISSWGAFVGSVKPRFDAFIESGGKGLRILTESFTSPTLMHQMTDLMKRLPDAVWHQYDPISSSHAYDGARMAFDESVDSIYHFDAADVVVSLDSDFLTTGPAAVRHARDFMSRRQALGASDTQMARLYAAESSVTLTGAKADHRIAVGGSDIEQLALYIASKLGASSLEAQLDERQQTWAEAVVADLLAAKQAGRATLITTGPWQSPVVHALVHLLNDQLGNVGQTVQYVSPISSTDQDHGESLASLVEAIHADDVQLLLILGGNPVYDAPADLAFADALDRVPLRVHHSLYDDETSLLCHWHVPAAHFLETWGDARAFDGTASVIQPLIAPLYDGKSAHEVLATLTGESETSTNEIVRAYWRSTQQLDDAAFDLWWRETLHNGYVKDSKSEIKPVSLHHEIEDRLKQSKHIRTGSFDVVIRPDPCIYDGRFANNGWLQEIPKPFSKITWENAAMISPAFATANQLTSGDIIILEDRGRELRTPVVVIPGHPDRSATICLGYGRTAAGRVGNDLGSSTYLIRHRQNPWFNNSVTLRKTNERTELATTQNHFLMENRHPIISGNVAQLHEDPEHPKFMDTGHGHHGEPVSMYPPHPYDGYKWGMSINLTSCFGCNACVIACQAENNIPIVGKEEVKRGRELHWIRIDTYYEGPADDPLAFFQPVPCMHCEKAPCEPVCPVAATSHSEEGVNEMTYNRCVGTRYCANNCPYKVRRFNFFHYTEEIQKTPVLHLLQNPDVTVRSRGVMEKCTYCIQRISEARIQSERENRSIEDGEVVTACQQVCPTQAIVFGDLNNEKSELSQTLETNHAINYSLLEDQNTRPRTTYLANIRNPNPDLESEHERHH